MRPWGVWYRPGGTSSSTTTIWPFLAPWLCRGGIVMSWKQARVQGNDPREAGVLVVAPDDARMLAFQDAQHRSLHRSPGSDFIARLRRPGGEPASWRPP